MLDVLDHAGALLWAVTGWLWAALLAPVLWVDRVEKERYIQMLPFTLRRHLLRLLFLPTLVWNYALHRTLKDRRWWDRVDDVVILGACPLPWHVAQLAHLGVTGVINCTDEYTGPVKSYEKYGIKQLRIPTLDFHIPSAQSVEEAIQFIEGQDGSVYIHCKAGRGRAAIVAACWLIHRLKLTPMQAQNRLQHIRPHVSPSLWKRDVLSKTFEGHDTEANGPLLGAEDLV
eukprot:EG_transcript_21491